MKTRLSFLLSLVCCIFFLSITSAQNNQTVYAVIEYMKVKPGMENQYVRTENNVWKPVHQERIQQGEIAGWYLYECRFPSGSAKEYDYVTVTLYNKFDQLEAPLENYKALMAKVHPGKKTDQLEKQTADSRQLVRGEVFSLLDRTIPAADNKVAKFLAVNFMKARPGQGSDYVMMEKQYWKNWHQIRIDDNAMNLWMLWGRVLPDGTEVEYDFITVDGFDQFSDMTIDQPEWAQRVQSKLPTGNTFSDIADKTVAARDLVRRELWKMVNYVNSPNEVAASDR